MGAAKNKMDIKQLFDSGTSTLYVLVVGYGATSQYIRVFAVVKDAIVEVTYDLSKVTGAPFVGWCEDTALRLPAEMDPAESIAEVVNDRLGLPPGNEGGFRGIRL
jgi:hypothetical protein